MKNNKSPGIDGFTVEFFKVFWIDLKLFILNSLNEGFDKGKLSETQRKGLIICLPKGDKARQFLKNWRPITLLNVIYKLASACIANRLKTVLVSIISDTQTGFLPGRYIGENSRLVYDLLHYTEKCNNPGLLILVDFEKAFDSLSWSFLYKVLELFNFGPNLIHWVKTFNTAISSFIVQNGYLSNPVFISRGCRQGDPVSSYLFLLVAEILAIMVKKNAKIKGVKIKEKQYCLSQFADDTTFILDGTEGSFNEALDTLEIFGKLSGLNINKEKTQVIWIGSKKFSSEVYHHRWKLKWGTTKFTLLGITLSVNLEEVVQLNYSKCIDTITKTLSQWSKRKLTPLGRITVLKSIIIPKMNHLFISLPNPDKDMIKHFNTLFYKFIWQSPIEKVKRQTLVKQYIYGGLKMIDIDNFIKSLKSTWIRRIITNNRKDWINVFEHTVCPTNHLVDFGIDLVKKITNH